MSAPISWDIRGKGNVFMIRHFANDVVYSVVLMKFKSFDSISLHFIFFFQGGFCGEESKGITESSALSNSEISGII